MDHAGRPRGPSGPAPSRLRFSASTIPPRPAAYIVFDAGAPSRDITAELLANDADPDGPASGLVITGVTPGPTPQGSLSFAHGAVTYQPNSSLVLANQQIATDTFTYTVADAQGASSIGSATVYIVGKNTPTSPQMPPSPSTKTQTLSPVTAIDAENDALTYSVGTTTAHGTLTLNASGQFTYLPSTNHTAATALRSKPTTVRPTAPSPPSPLRSRP